LGEESNLGPALCTRKKKAHFSRKRPWQVEYEDERTTPQPKWRVSQKNDDTSTTEVDASLGG